MKLISLFTVMTIVYSVTSHAQTFEAKNACDVSLPERATVLRQECKRISPTIHRLQACNELVMNSREAKSKEIDFIKCLEYRTTNQINLDQMIRSVDEPIFIENEIEFSQRIRACGRLHTVVTNKFDCLDSAVPILQLNLCGGSESVQISQRCHEVDFASRIKFIPACLKLKLNDPDLFQACIETAQGSPDKLTFCGGIPRLQNQQQLQFRCIQSSLSEKQVALCVYSDNQRGENFLTRLEGIGCFPSPDDLQK